MVSVCSVKCLRGQAGIRHIHTCVKVVSSNWRDGPSTVVMLREYKHEEQVWYR